MTSSTHSFAYSYRLFKKRFVENYENSKCHIFLIFSDLHQIFTVLFEIFYSFYCINLNLDRISPLKAHEKFNSRTISLQCRLQVLHAVGMAEVYCCNGCEVRTVVLGKVRMNWSKLLPTFKKSNED